MRFWLSYIATLVFVVVAVGIEFWYVQPMYGENGEVLTPVPDFLSFSKNEQVATMQLFLPRLPKVGASSISAPQITAKSALIYDLTTKRALFAKNPDQKLPMASLTKVMTAVIALENKRDDNRYYVYEDALVGENSMGLSSGEALRLEDLLYGLILRSGNDAAEVLARNYPKGREQFIAAMNNKAKALGLINTDFTNPTGLEGEGDQHSTAYDLLVIAHYAMSNYALFRQVAQTITYEIPQTNEHAYYYLENETNLLRTYPGVKGIKTGFTNEAGYCLLTYLKYQGREIIGVLLGSEDRRQEMKELLDYSLKSLGLAPPATD